MPVKNRLQAEELAAAIAKVATYSSVHLISNSFDMLAGKSERIGYEYEIGFHIPSSRQKKDGDKLRHYSHVIDECMLYAELFRIITSYYMEES